METGFFKPLSRQMCAISRTLSKERTAIRKFRKYPNLKTRPYWGNHFWADGYCVDTVGVNEEMIRMYVRYQEKQERRFEQQRFKFD